MPRLQPGQIAPAKEREEKENTENTGRIIAALEEALKDPSQTPQEVLDAYRTWRRLAAWQDSQRKINPMSETTLRKYVKRLYPGGESAFNRDRERLFERLEKAGTKPGTKAALQNERDRWREYHQTLVNQVLEFSAQYGDLLQTATKLAKAHPTLEDDLKQHIKKYPNAYRGLRVMKGGRDDD